MSDGIAPAIDKVGEPAPTAPEAQAAVPTSEDSKPDEEKADEKKPEDGAKPALKVPKPVEVMSVPQTPLNNSTPAGGTPRPELKIDEEPKEKPQEEPPFILGLKEPESTPAESTKDSESVADKPAEAATNGTSDDVEMTGALPSSNSSESASREKRKLEEEPASTTTNGDSSSDDKSGSDARSDKKARVEDAPAPAVPNGKGAKAKREKKTAPVVGRTARKTRSQGPVEV